MDSHVVYHVDCVGVFAGFALEGGVMVQVFGVVDLFFGGIRGAFV